MSKQNFSIPYTKIIICLFAVAICVALREKVISAILPFALSFLISLPIQRLAKKISSKTKLPHTLCACLILISVIALLFFLLRMGAVRLFDEIRLLAGKIDQDPRLITGIFISAREKLSAQGLLSRLLQDPELQIFSQILEDALSNAFSSIVSTLFEKMSELAMGFAQKIPSFILFLSVFLISGFYFSCDDGRIRAFLGSVLPRDENQKISQLVKQAQGVCISYFCASLTLGLFSFLILLIGLCIIGSKYALFLALLIAVIDFLPIFGASCVLLPWSVICFINSDIKTAVGLLIICAVIVIFRQIAEPKIIGKNIGLHPLATLCSVYMGIQILGAWGLLLGPVIAVGIKGILEAKSIDKRNLI